MSNLDIDNLASRLGITMYVGTYSRDTVKTLPKPTSSSDQYAIMNLETHLEAGSHWVCLAYTTKHMMYFDSYGLYPPEELQVFAKHHGLKIYYQNERLQQNSKRCGWFCLKFGIMYCIDHISLAQITPKNLNEKIVLQFQRATNARA